jgi:hypothetical protein
MEDDRESKKSAVRFLDHNTAILAFDDSFIKKLKSGKLTADDGEDVERAMAEISLAMRDLVKIKPN